MHEYTYTDVSRKLSVPDLELHNTLVLSTNTWEADSKRYKEILFV